MEISKETRDRIFAAADALYEQLGQASFPTVYAVRKAAGVNMNDASAGMREWRRARTTQVTPAAAQIPAAVLQASNTALSTLWQEAQSVATDALRSAQAGWDVERAEAETLNQQLADAYEAQATELEAAQARIAVLEVAVKEADTAVDKLRAECAEKNQNLRDALAQLQAKSETLVELKAERDEARSTASAAREEVALLRGQVQALERVLALKSEN